MQPHMTAGWVGYADSTMGCHVTAKRIQSSYKVWVAHQLLTRIGLGRVRLYLRQDNLSVPESCVGL